MLERQRTAIQSQLTDTVDKLEQGRQFFQLALGLLADPQGFYRRGSDNVKRALTKAIFAKLHIDAEAVAGHTATDGLAALIATGSAATPASNDKSDPLPKEEIALDRLTEAGLLAVILSDHGSSRAAMVGPAGFEPATNRL